MKKTAGLVLLTLTLSACAASLGRKDRFAKVRIRPAKVAGHVYVLYGAGGNIGVSVGPDGTLIVDDQFAPLAGRIREALQGLGGGRVEFLLNTHWHGDHVGGNVIFGREAHIIAHTNTRRRLSTPQTTLRGRIPARPRVAWPVITFDRSMSVHFNGEEIKLLHLPHGHTDTDVAIFFTRSNVVHLGDHFFAGRFPFVDLAHGGNVLGLIRNVGRLLRRLRPGVKIIPGHGRVSTLADLRAYHRVLAATTEIIRKRMERGESLAQIRREGLPARYGSWSKGYVNTARWIGFVHESLRRRGRRGRRGERHRRSRRSRRSRVARPGI